ncbi:hypothetical protein Tdes44962_MAKER00987 [Teratosphaeria destructans]|uniref:Uncharacterized protein n=1 Tax=Teratosphaeria destructans TaxID=418781 RepID=A0A9W7SJC0_9PEZI|nr:hypothetical protein Tdes44962_MAKER00987 [Teratosphaeria destructans]
MQLHSEQLYAKLTRLILLAEGDRSAKILYNSEFATQPSWTDEVKPLLTDTDDPITIRYMFDLLDEDELKRQDRFEI